MNLTITVKGDKALLTALEKIGVAFAAPATVGEALVQRSPLPADPAPPSAAPAAAEAPAEGAVTKDNVLAALKEVQTTIGKEAAVKLLEAQGARNLSSLAVEKYASIVGECAAALKAHAEGGGDLLA